MNASSVSAVRFLVKTLYIGSCSVLRGILPCEKFPLAVCMRKNFLSLGTKMPFGSLFENKQPSNEQTLSLLRGTFP